MTACRVTDPYQQMRDLDCLSRFFDCMPTPAFAVDADLRLVISNSAHRALTRSHGIKVESPVGYHILEVAPFLTPEVLSLYEGVFRTGQPVSGEMAYDINGHMMDVDVIRFPISCEDRVAYVGVVLTDITALKKTRDRLKESEETARALMNSSTEAMFLVGENEVVIAANTTASDRLGHNPRELEGMSIADAMTALSPELVTTRLEHFRRVRQTGLPIRFTDQRNERILENSIFPVRTSSGEARLMAVYSRDVTEYETAIKALGASEKRFRDLFEQTPVATYVWRWNGQALVLNDFNEAAEQLTEGGIRHYLGKSAQQMYSESHPDIVKDLLSCYRTRTHLQREMSYELMTTKAQVYFEVHYVFVAPHDVLVLTVDLTARKQIENDLKRSREELEQRVMERTQELAELNEQLRIEREALDHKTAAMRELISQLNSSRGNLENTLQTNLQNIVIPILDRLDRRLRDEERIFIRLLRDSLAGLLSPHMSQLRQDNPRLTAHEIELCNLIRSGFSCKEIAQMRGRSELTILKQRKLIRKKLGISDSRTDLRQFLIRNVESNQLE